MAWNCSVSFFRYVKIRVVTTHALFYCLLQIERYVYAGNSIFTEQPSSLCLCHSKIKYIKRTLIDLNQLLGENSVQALFTWPCLQNLNWV